MLTNDQLSNLLLNEKVKQTQTAGSTQAKGTISALETKQRAETKQHVEENTAAALPISPAAAPILYLSNKAKQEKYYLHVVGDSISQGLRPGPTNEFILEICNGLNVDEPWPLIMGKMLRQYGVKVSVENHSESGRRLSGRTDMEGGRNSLGEKDGRVALQGIVNSIINKHSENNDKIVIMINLGTNDLHEPNLNAEYLKGSFIKHVLTILTDPNLQFKLSKKLDKEERLVVLEFMKKINKFTGDDIRSNYCTHSLASMTSLTPLAGPEAQATQNSTPVAKVVTHGEQFNDIISEKNRPLIQKLFNMIAWNVILVPPVEMSGYPFGKEMFASVDLSKQWTKIVQEVVQFFNVKNIFSVEKAQSFVIPHTDEFGGCVHFDEKDHPIYAQKMVDFMLECPQLKMKPVKLESELAHAGKTESAKESVDSKEGEKNKEKLRN